MNGNTQRRSDRRKAVAAWCALTAPGVLITCAILTVTLLVVTRVTPLVAVPRAVRNVAATLLVLHAAVTFLLWLKPASWSVAVLFLGVLATDGLLCGVLLGANHAGPAPLLAVAVLVMSLEVGGWRAAVSGVVACAVGAGAAVWWGVATTLFLATGSPFATTLAIETSFAGTVVNAPPVTAYPTLLSVETSFGGVPAFATSEELFVPALALVIAALCLGLAMSVWRVRRVRTAVAAAIVAAARVTP